MHEEQAEVLIAGGGPAGLAAAIELGDNGFEPLILERRRGLSGQPRVTTLTAQAMQLMWRWGIADEVSRQGFPAEPAVSVRASLTAPELRRVPLTEHVWSCPQDRLEEILSVRALAGGAEIRYGTQLIGLRPAADGAVATAATADGVAAGIRARYVIGADGARSVVRQACGIGASPPRHPEHWLSIMFRAPLRDHVSDPPFMLYELEGPAGDGCFVVPADARDRWVMCLQWHPELGQSRADYGSARCAGLVRTAAGLPGLAVQVQSVRPFQLARAGADKFRAGRVLLAGNAARAFPSATAPGFSVALQDGAAAADVIARALARGDDPDTLDDYESVRQRADQLPGRDLLSHSG